MSFRNYLEKLTLPKKQWVTVPFDSLDEEDKKKLWLLYDVTYSAIGYNNYSSFKALEDAGYELVKLVDIDEDTDPDAFIFTRSHGQNKKICLLGSDGQKESKRELMRKFFELLRTPGYYMEASKKGGRLREMIDANNIPYIDDPEIIRKKQLIHKDFKWIGDGEYYRPLTGTDQKIIKKIYGTIK
jgi:hypothetical protein